MITTERLRALLSFDGRSSRRQFWRWYLTSTLISAVIVTLALFAAVALGPFGAPLFLLLLPVFWANLANCVRRGHDRGKSSLWVLAVGAAPLLLIGLIEFLEPWAYTTAGALAGLAALLLGLALEIWWIVELGFRRGQKAANRYGGPVAV